MYKELNYVTPNNEIVGLESNESPKFYYTIHNVRKEVQLKEYPTDLVFIPEGKEYYCCKVPFKTVIKTDKNGKQKKISKQRVYGNPTQFLIEYTTNYILLNPGITKEIVIEELCYVVKYHVDKPVSLQKIEDLVDMLFEDIDELVPYNVTLKYNWIKPNIPNKLETYRNRTKFNLVFKEAVEKYFRNLPESKIKLKDLSAFIKCDVRGLYKILTEEQLEIIKSHNDNIKKSKPKRIIKRTTKKKNP